MSAKKRMMQEIEAKAKRKKQLSQALSMQKTVARLAKEYFDRVQEARDLDMCAMLEPMALNSLQIALAHQIDRHCYVCSNAHEGCGSDELKIEIRWSQHYADETGCDQTMVLDAASAEFQHAMEQI